MTIPEAREAVYQEFIDVWANRTPVVLENEAGDGDGLSVSWAHVFLKGDGAEQASIGAAGNRIFDRFARVYIDIHSPINAGTDAGSSLATAARDIFEARRIGDLVFLEGRVDEIGVRGKWYITRAEIKLTFDERK